MTHIYLSHITIDCFHLKLSSKMEWNEGYRIASYISVSWVYRTQSKACMSRV